MNTYPGFDPSNQPAAQTPFIKFLSSEGIHITTGESSDRAAIVLDPEVDYPLPQVGDALSGLLLESPSGDEMLEARKLLLPENYVTMAQAMNDAIGDNASDESVSMTRDLFSEVGTALRQVAERDRKVPRHISYKHFIFSREDYQPKLLPPIEFIDFGDGDYEQAIKHVEKSLYDSCLRGAANTTQKRNLSPVFAGFIRAFED